MGERNCNVYQLFTTLLLRRGNGTKKQKRKKRNELMNKRTDDETEVLEREKLESVKN